MITRILVPTDFSEVANNALKYAIGLAIQTKATIDIVHIKTLPVMDLNFPADTYSVLMDEMEAAAKVGIAHLETTLLKPAGVTYRLHITTGFVTDEIHKVAQQGEADLIVMGTTGASGLQELLIGSNAASVIGKSEVPVLIIPASATFTEFKHILYASDYSEPEFPAVARLKYFAELNDADVTVLHVTTDFDRYFNAERNFFVRNKQHIREEKINMVKSDQSDVAEGINQYTAAHQVDLVVLAKHNRSFFDRLFHRSLSKRMAYHTTIPLLVLQK